MRKFLCLYLNTGGGHRAPAKVLKQIMETAYPDAEVILAEGLSSKNKLERFVFEKCYQIGCNFIPGSWALFFQFTSLRLVQSFITTVLHPHTTWYMRRLIRRYKATDVVSFHFILTPSLVSAIRQVNPSIKLSVFVTDPFSCSTAWFYEKSLDYIVSSSQVENFAIEKCGIPRSQIHVFPFLINPKFYTEFPDDYYVSLRAEHGIEEGKKVLLITGGAGGLPNLVLIIQQLIKLKPRFTILVVCGNDKPSKTLLDVLVQLYPQIDLRIMGYVTNMDELINLCDLAIIKPGASTIFEVLGSKKPVIISTYLHGQELGNVQFAVKNKVGWFIRKPKDIASTAFDLLNNEEKLQKVKARLKTLKIDKNMDVVADYLYSKDR